MKIESRSNTNYNRVDLTIDIDGKKIKTAIDTHQEADNFIWELRDVMASFYRIWPDLMEATE